MTVVNTVLHIWKLVRVNLKSSHHKKKNSNYASLHGDGCKISCGDHFAMYTNIESWYLTLVCYMSIIHKIKTFSWRVLFFQRATKLLGQILIKLLEND